MKKYIFIILGAALVVSVIAGVLYYGYREKPLVGNDRDEHGCIGSAGYQWCEAKNKCLRIWEESCDPGVRNFRSEALGISFEYPSKVGDIENVNSKEEGDRVYVYFGEDAKNGQWVQVFTKNADETFEEAVKRQILAGFTSEICKISVMPAGSIAPFLPDALKGEITYPSAGDEASMENLKKCNEKYARTNGLRYFIYDQNHPDKFLYFDIGQYFIPVNGRPWQETIKML